MYTDASDVGLGAVLEQEGRGVTRALARGGPGGTGGGPEKKTTFSSIKPDVKYVFYSSIKSVIRCILYSRATEIGF